MGFSAHSGYVEVAGTTTIISKTLPPGNYVLFARVSLQNLGFVRSDDAFGDCTIPGDHGPGPSLPGDETSASMALTSAISHAGGAIELKCTETGGDIDVSSASLSGVKVDSLG
jgi:hypothetical protein